MNSFLAPLRPALSLAALLLAGNVAACLTYLLASPSSDIPLRGTTSGLTAAVTWLALARPHARYSALSTDKGYYLPGLGSYSEFFLGETLTRKTTRLSLGAGYRFNSALNLKLEYTFEDARRMTGAKRDDEDQFAAELAVKF